MSGQAKRPKKADANAEGLGSESSRGGAGNVGEDMDSGVGGGAGAGAGAASEPIVNHWGVPYMSLSSKERSRHRFVLFYMLAARASPST